MEDHAGCHGAVQAMEQTLKFAREPMVLTPDLKGTNSTAEVVAFVLTHLYSVPDKSFA